MKNTFKLFEFIALVAVIGLIMTTCDNEIDQPSPIQSGIHLGIVGFNDDVFLKEISVLNASTKNSFQSFINNMELKNNTALFHAVNTAMNRLDSAKGNFPANLSNVSIITFTDGMDNISHRLNSSYQGEGQYQNAVKNRIDNFKINNVDVLAYSIGLLGRSGGGGADLMTASLNSIASNPPSQYVKMSDDIDQINEEFKLIAESLNKKTTHQTIGLTYPPPFVGNKVRFTFDNAGLSSSTMTSSTIYIEGTYSDNDFLTDIVYVGLQSTSGTSVKGVKAAGSNSYILSFEELKLYPSENEVPMNNLNMWRRSASVTTWTEEVEFDRNQVPVIEIKESSIAIILVLDCSNSLGATDFSRMKTIAYNFIDVLLGSNKTYTVTYNANGGIGTTPTSQSVIAENNVTLASGSGLSRSGFTFGGWNTNTTGTGTNYNAGSSYTPIGNVTLYARWFLNSNTWVNDTIPSGRHTYSFRVTTGNTYYVWLNNRVNGNGTKTGDVGINARYSAQNENYIFGNNTSVFNNVWGTPQSFTANQTGTVYIQVAIINDGSPGTYGIVYSTVNSRPTP